MVKNPPANTGDVRDMDSIPGSGRSPGEGNGNSLQYSCLENPMGREAWQTSVHGVTRVGHDLKTSPTNTMKKNEDSKEESLASIAVVALREGEMTQNGENNFNSLCILIWLKTSLN